MKPDEDYRQGADVYSHSFTVRSPDEVASDLLSGLHVQAHYTSRELVHVVQAEW